MLLQIKNNLQVNHTETNQGEQSQVSNILKWKIMQYISLLNLVFCKKYGTDFSVKKSFVPYDIL